MIEQEGFSVELGAKLERFTIDDAFLRGIDVIDGLDVNAIRFGNGDFHIVSPLAEPIRDYGSAKKSNQSSLVYCSNFGN